MTKVFVEQALAMPGCDKYWRSHRHDVTHHHIRKTGSSCLVVHIKEALDDIVGQSMNPPSVEEGA